MEIIYYELIGMRPITKCKYIPFNLVSNIECLSCQYFEGPDIGFNIKCGYKTSIIIQNKKDQAYFKHPKKQ